MARLSRRARLKVLAGVALALATVAGVLNYNNYWRQPPARAAETPAPPTPSFAPTPVDDRPRQILQLVQHLARTPQDRDARFRLAHLYFQMHDYTRSMTELRILARDHPKDAEVFLRQAVVLKYEGKPAAAEQAARRALTLKPDYDLAREWLGEVTLDQGRLRDADRIFDACLRKRPDSVFALLGKGRAQEQLFQAKHPIRVDDMLAPVEEAVKLEPNNPDAAATLARMKFAYLEGSQASEEAEQLALRAVQLDPGNAQPYITLAQIYLARPPTPETMQKVASYAYEAGQRALQDPRPPYLVGRVALYHNDPDRAIKALERSIALHPLPEAVTQIAVAYRRAGNGERANHYAAIYQRYTDLTGRRDTLMGIREREPREVRHYYALADLYLEAGQPDHAEQWLKEAQRLRPRDPRSESLRARIRALRQKGSDGPLLPIE